MSESKSQAKPFEVSKHVVWEAYLRVKANKGAAPYLSGCRETPGCPGSTV